MLMIVGSSKLADGGSCTDRICGCCICSLAHWLHERAVADAQLPITAKPECGQHKSSLLQVPKLELDWEQHARI
jgi:hypothetical protein